MIERRQVSPLRLFRRFAGPLAGPWAAFPLVFAGGLWLAGMEGAPPPPPAPETREIVEEIPVELTILEKTRLPGGPGAGATHLVRYTFRAPEGAVMEETSEVAPEVFAAVEVGQRVMDVWRRTRTETLPPPPAADAPGPGGIPGVRPAALALLAAMGLWLLHAARTARSATRAARDGEVREARVTAHHRTNTTIDRERMWRLGWRDAAAAEGVSRMRPQAALPAVGSVIVVYEDPASGRVWWEGDL